MAEALCHIGRGAREYGTMRAPDVRHDCPPGSGMACPQISIGW